MVQPLVASCLEYFKSWFHDMASSEQDVLEVLENYLILWEAREEEANASRDVFCQGR